MIRPVLAGLTALVFSVGGGHSLLAHQGPIVLQTVEQAEATAERISDSFRRDGGSGVRTEAFVVMGAPSSRPLQALLGRLDARGVPFESEIVTRESFDAMAEQWRKRLPSGDETEMLTAEIEAGLGTLSPSERSAIGQWIAGIPVRLAALRDCLFGPRGQESFLASWVVRDEQGNWHRRFGHDKARAKMTAIVTAASLVANFAGLVGIQGKSWNDPSVWALEGVTFFTSSFFSYTMREWGVWSVSSRVIWPIPETAKIAVGRSYRRLYAFLGGRQVFSNALALACLVPRQELLFAIFTRGFKNAALRAFSDMVPEKHKGQHLAEEETAYHQGDREKTEKAKKGSVFLGIFWGAGISNLLTITDLAMGPQDTWIQTCLSTLPFIVSGTVCLYKEKDWFAKKPDDTLIARLRGRLWQWKHRLSSRGLRCPYLLKTQWGG